MIKVGVLVAAVVASVSVAPTALAQSHASTAQTAGSYTSVAPTRVLDTRYAIGTSTRTPVPAHGTVTVLIAGKGSPSVPVGASAVVLNLTATHAQAPGYVTAYSASGSQPTVSNLNFAVGQTVPNLAIVPLSSSGSVKLYNGASGTVDLIADLSGYYTGGTPPASAQGAFTAVSPTRLLDTRVPIGVPVVAPVKANTAVTFQVEGLAGVPVDVAAAALNITVTHTNQPGYITAYASQSTRTTTSVLTFARGQTAAALSIVRTGGDGKVTLYNGSSGTVDLIADVQGYFAAGDPVDRGDFGALPPARALSAVTIGAGATYIARLGGVVGIPQPPNASTIFLSLTVAHPTRPGYVVVYDASGATPSSSNINFVAGQTATNFVAAPSSSGSVAFHNGSAGTVQIFVDVAGYASALDAPLPSIVSSSHYVRKLAASPSPGDLNDPSSTGVGCSDARAGVQFVLLDIGAQLNNRTGVALSVVNTAVTYDALVSGIDNYVTSYRGCAPSAGLTLAVGTNNDGDFTAYPASNRGADWANKVVDAISAPAGVTVEGADDIEASFASTQDQALQWTSAFLANASTKKLIYNGSLDGCPDVYGSVVSSCEFGWTAAKYLQLTHNSVGQIEVLPQVYTAAEARQWTNLYRTSGGSLVFAGSLTEYAACGSGCSVVATQGWAFLYHGLSTVASSPSLPVAADLDVLD